MAQISEQCKERYPLIYTDIFGSSGRYCPLKYTDIYGYIRIFKDPVVVIAIRFIEDHDVAMFNSISYSHLMLR